MEITTKIKNNNFISVIVRGDFDYTVAGRNFENIIALCRTKELSRILVDFSGVTGEVLATHKIFAAIAGINAFNLHFNSKFNSLKIAMIGREQCLKEKTTYTPVIDILKMAGIDAMVTHETDRAVDWITRSEFS